MIRYLIIGIVLLSIVQACGSSKDAIATKAPKDDPLKAAYYEQLSHNLQRLVALRTGFFVQRRQSRETGAVFSNKTETGDSIMVYARTVGNPHRDGHWVFHLQYLSGLPDEPLVLLIERFEKVSRDTFMGYMHYLPKMYTLDELSAKAFNADNLNLKTFRDTSKILAQYTYVRRDATHFDGFSPLLPPMRQNLRDKVPFRRDFFQYAPKYIRFSMEYLDQDTMLLPTYSSDMWSYFERIPPEAFEIYKNKQYSQE